MDRSDLQNRIRLETRANVLNVTDTEINDLLDNGTLKVANMWRWPFLVTSAQVSVTAAKEVYDLSSDLSVTDFNMAYLVYRNNDDQVLLPITYQKRIQTWGDDPETSTEAEYYYIEDDATGLGLVPVPSTTASNAYTFVYYKTPTLMTQDTHTPEWASAYHDVLIDYVASIIYTREEYYTQAQVHEQKFISKISEMKRYYRALRTPEQEPFIYGGRATRPDPWANWPKGLYWGY